MANTSCSLNIHCIFSTKERAPILNPELRERLWLFLGGIAKQNGITPRRIGGVADHVHLLLSLPTTVPIAKAIQLIKAGSSAWIDQTFRQLHNFSWQQGDGAFSVSVSQLPETIHSIQNQVEHHRSRTFPQEDLAFLKRHEHSTRGRLLMPGLSFDDKYLWD
jgi:putative transposase